MTTWHGMTKCRPIGYFDPAMDPEWCPLTSFLKFLLGSPWFTLPYDLYGSLWIFMDLYGSLWIQVVSHRNGASLSTRNGCPTRYYRVHVHSVCISPISPPKLHFTQTQEGFPTKPSSIPLLWELIKGGYPTPQVTSYWYCKGQPASPPTLQQLPRHIRRKHSNPTTAGAKSQRVKWFSQAKYKASQMRSVRDRPC